MSGTGVVLVILAVAALLLALVFDSTLSGVAIVFAIFALMDMLNRQHIENKAQLLAIGGLLQTRLKVGEDIE